MSGLKNWFKAPPKPEKPVKKAGGGYKGWHAEVAPTPRIDYWTLFIIDDEGNKWGPSGASGRGWDIHASSEKDAIKQGRQKLKMLADREIKKREWAEKKKIII